DISQDLMPSSLGLAVEKNNSLLHEFGTFGGHDMGTGDFRIAVSVMKHRDGNADVESTHHDGCALRFEFQRKLPSPRKHVGLNSDETDDNPGVGSGTFFHDLQGVHSASHGSFVECDYSAENPVKLRRGKSRFSQRPHGCQCVARENSLIELDKVTLPVVLRHLHEYDNQLSDTSTGFGHLLFLRIALMGGDTKKSPGVCTGLQPREAFRW